MKRLDITPSWFFTEIPYPLRLLQIYIRGDALVLVPFMLLLGFIGFFSLQWMGIVASIYLVFRFLGEMIYWLLQQFGPLKYRPYDFGCKALDNNAIYILYQLFSLVGLVASCSLFLFLLVHLLIPNT